RQLKRAKPEALISILARTGAMSEPFRRLSEVDEVVVCGAKLKGTLNLIREARKRRADLYLIPFPSNRWEYNALQFTSRARIRLMHRYEIGRFRALSFLPAQRVDAVRGLHDVVQNLRLLSALDVSIDETEAPEFILRDEDRIEAKKLLDSVSIQPNEKFIVIHAGSAQTVLAEAKRWGAENYARLIESMSAMIGSPIIVVEGPDEAGVSDEIISKVNDRSLVRSLKLKGSLGTSAALLDRARLYVGTDSGLAHLASSVGTRAVTLFAPADPDRVCPFGNRDLVVQSPRNCSPCMEYPWKACKPSVKCREPMCIREISVEMVMAKVRLAMKETK
ncbi:MAG TPA: glycosyltransferase family 9 protein, partial [Tepidisphaeraceae bacterium]|nr:glycosyltransferase family 9 protein [Tepidisphaeraceae bacterium]